MPIAVLPRLGTDIEGETGFGGEVCWPLGGVDFGGVQGVVLGEEGVPIAVVVDDACHAGWTARENIGSSIQNVARYWEGDSQT